MNKYRNQKITIDGHTFDSKKEGKRYLELKLLERGGAIKYLELQPRIKIEIGGIPVKFDTGRQVYYTADFRYVENDKYILEDVKGYKTPVYKLKKAMVRAMGMEILET